MIEVRASASFILSNGTSDLTAASNQSRLPRFRRHRVLHIEDNSFNLKLVERIFAQRPDVEVVAAMHGSLGLELAREHGPSLILLDLHLPDIGGEQVLQRLRDDPVAASIPVAIVAPTPRAGRSNASSHPVPPHTSPNQSMCGSSLAFSKRRSTAELEAYEGR